ncbi:odorant receptor 47b [Fopius arisanus]|uniref:Odorant receptor n=2 Tax=Fopius arisanus TaxID=64838 RepID=A0A9R1TV54_9HYME|nr:PREDICTED: odorant receptor 47b-like [Fopius arisanus]
MSTVKSNMRERVFPIDKSYLYFNLNVLSVMGIWNPWEEGYKYWVYKIYEWYVIIVIMAMRLTAILVRGISAEDTTQLLQEFSLLAVEAADTIKYIAYIFHREEVLELCSAFNWDRHLLGTEEITQFRNKVLTHSLSSSKTFTIAIVVAVILYYCFYYYAALGYSEYQLDKLPIRTVPLKYCFILTNFWVAFICDYITFTWLGLIAVTHDAFIMALMINITSQLEILNFRLEKCHREIFEISNDKIPQVPNLIHFECVEREMNGKSVTLDPNAELINCIKFHQHIIKMLNMFRAIYDKALLPQLLISLLLVSMSAFQMILGQQGDQSTSDSVGALVFLIACILQLLAFCWGGNIILVESEKTSDSLYASHWYYRNTTFRNNVKIFLGAIKNPLIVSAGGLVDLSAETFKNILTKGYSASTVLKNTA